MLAGVRARTHAGGRARAAAVLAISKLAYWKSQWALILWSCVAAIKYIFFCCSIPGSPAYDSVRPLSYQEADVFLLCYKISDPISLYNVKNKWIRELRQHRPDVPVILCGCQSDLRQDMATLNHLSKTGRTPISPDQALAICCEIQAVNYVETSAKFPLENNISEAFELCALASIKSKTKPQHHGAFS